ncbi:MAG TPA: hypothetical protein VKX25_17840 [Bryobacteraceae bacterium]|jgi:uncharacterized membrane protein|nr:hypothetical protein [Bryobacteraceae bacterium]
MLIHRKVVRRLFWSLSAAAVFVALCQLFFQPRNPWLRVNSALFRAQAAAGYLVGVLYASRMRNEYPEGSGMRRAWGWMIAGVVSFLAYQTLDTLMVLCPFLRSVPTEDAWLIGVTLSLALVLLGLFQMWWTFRDAGFSPELSRSSWAVVGIVAALTIARMAHGLEPHHLDASLLFRSIRGTSPLLVGAGTAVGFLLYRMTAGFGEGKFSRTIRGLLLFFAVHLLLFQLDWYPSLWNVPVIDAATDVLYYVLPWVLACALTECWEVGIEAKLAVEHYQIGEYRHQWGPAATSCSPENYLS